MIRSRCQPVVNVLGRHLWSAVAWSAVAWHFGHGTARTCAAGDTTAHRQLSALGVPSDAHVITLLSVVLISTHSHT